MHFTRSTKALAASVVGLSLALSGFLGASFTSANAAGTEAINVWGWSGAPGAATMAKVITAFQGANPSIKVTYNEITNTEYANKATLGLSSGQSIDVLGVFPNNWAKDNQNFLLPVSQWPNATGLLNKFQPSTIAQEKKLYSDGVIRSVPLDSNGSAVGYYNVDLLKKAGFTSPPKTWADLKKLSVALKKKVPGAVAAVIPSDSWFQDDFMETLIGQYDPNFWNSIVYNKGTWDTAALRQALTRYRSLYADGTLDKSTLDIKYSDAQALFTNGKAAIMFSGTWDAGLLLRAYRTANKIKMSDAGAMAVPGDDPTKLGLRSFLDTTYGIPAKSTHQAAAEKFIEFMTAGKGVNAWGPALVGVPAVKNWSLPAGVLKTATEKSSYKLLQSLIGNPHSDRNVLSNFEGQQGLYDLQVAAGTLTSVDAAKKGQADLDSGKYN